MTANPTWSHDQITTLRQRWASGATSYQISTEIGKTRSAVLGKISRLGLAKKGAPVIKPKIWLIGEEIELGKMWEKGIPLAVIGKRFGVSPRAISAKRERLGMTPRPIGNHNPYGRPKLSATKRLLKPMARHKPKPINAPTCEPVGLFQRIGCAFPVKRTTEHLFCNSVTEKTYCDYHAQIMVQQR